MLRARTGSLLRWGAVATFVAWVFLLAYMLGAASNANAAASDTVVATQSQPKPVLEHRRDQPQTSVATVSRNVMCPTCDTTLDSSHSPAAERMRVWIRVAVANGWSEDEITAGLVNEYGGDESILAVPRAEGIGLLAWLVPLAVVLAAASCGLLLVRRWRRTQRLAVLENSASSSGQSSSP
ncbi:MAG: cytochrome c-type biogenesis protein CcmH [Thermoleophilia bacterium]|nr:cytochrome c-type biogenesis protein CcmH [Thermoleophilia bacterium]